MGARTALTCASRFLVTVSNFTQSSFLLDSIFTQSSFLLDSIFTQSSFLLDSTSLPGIAIKAPKIAIKASGARV